MTGLEGLLAGRVLGGRYRIEEVIGRGGMGAVYRAVDERLGREVAVKVVTVAGAADPEARERLRARFLREARAAAALPHHPNVVPVYDYGTDPTLGLDYIVMELLRGSDLADRLARSGPPPLSQGLRILYEAARGVALGHRAGLIHRDVKPGNIFLAEGGHDEVQVRVLDFGIAKLVSDEDTTSQLTQAGQVPHSPAYASPEQLRGLDRLTPAADVFSLGAVGFQLLTGERPFSEADRNRMALGMPVAPRSLRQLNPAIPAAIDAAVQRALSFDAEQRQPDAGVLVAELDQGMRAIAQTPLEPYPAAVPGPRDAAPPEDDDRTQIIDDGDHTRIMDDGDRTLMAPPPEPPRRVAPAARASAPPSRPLPPPPPREPERSGWGGIVVWTLVFVVLAAAGVWVWMDMNRGTRRAVEAPVPDSIEVVIPEVAAPESIGEPRQLEPAMHNTEGLRLLREGDFEAALAQFRTARDLAPTVPEYRLNYAIALRSLGDAAAAEIELERVAAMVPDQAAPYFQLGLTRLALQDTLAARAALQRAAELASGPVEQAAVQRELQRIGPAQAPPAPASGTPSPTPGVQPAPAAQPVDTAALPRDTASNPQPTGQDEG